MRVVVGGDLRVLNSTFARNKGPANRIGGLTVVAGAATRVVTFQWCSSLKQRRWCRVRLCEHDRNETWWQV
jgi:hypothetical protein